MPIMTATGMSASSRSSGMYGKPGMLKIGGGDYRRLVTDHGYLCRCCGERHDGLPFAYGPDAPAPWHDGLAGDESSVLEQDFCIIQAEHFFLRGRLVIPVHDADQDFAWTVWVSLSRPNFSRALDLWTTPGREQEPPYFGWLCTELPVYPATTLHLKTHVHTQASVPDPSSNWRPPTIRSPWSSALESPSTGSSSLLNSCSTHRTDSNQHPSPFPASAPPQRGMSGSLRSTDHRAGNENVP
jgi:hypothetical protein